MSEKTHRTDYEKYMRDLAEFMDANGCKLRPFPKIHISNRKQDGVFIRTAFYDPDKKEITVFCNNRHIKDILRSVAHEFIHHNQNLEGRLNNYSGDTLGQDDNLDRLEEEAYKMGNILFRKWTETKTKSEKPEKTFTKHMRKQIKLNEGELKHLISEIIQEAFKSKKLTSFAKQHGGLTNGNWSQSFGNDLYNMSDEEFDQYHTTDKDQHYRQYGIGGFNNPEDYDNLSFKPMEFNDGTFMVKKPSHEYDEREKALRQKREDRYNSRGRRGDKNYQYVNPYLNKLINNDHPDQYTHHEPRGNWGFPGEGEMTKTQLNPRAIKQNHIFSTYDGNEKWDMERDLENGNYEENNLDKNIVGKAYQSHPKQMNEEVLRRIISKILKETF